MFIIFVAILAMAASDWFDACSTVAEARGKSRLAGRLTAADNTLALFVGVVGADTLITHGWQEALIMGVLVFVVTDITTDLATKWASKKA